MSSRAYVSRAFYYASSVMSKYHDAITSSKRT